MIKHIIAGLAVVLSIWAFIHVYSLDKEVHKIQRISELIEKSQIKVKLNKNVVVNTNSSKTTAQNTSKVNNEMDEKLKALRDKAGNVALFKVSALYKKNCSSCHGSAGEGIIGPKLIGQTKEKVLQSLQDFKSGKKKNYVMYGLLGNLKDAQLVELSKEIGQFQSKLDAINK
jgi:cytochrome c553